MIVTGDPANLATSGIFCDPGGQATGGMFCFVAPKVVTTFPPTKQEADRKRREARDRRDLLDMLSLLQESMRYG